MTDNNSIPKYPNVTVKLTDEDGNAFAILGRVTKAMREAGVEQNEIALFNQTATAGNYDQLLQTVMKWVEVE